MRPFATAVFTLTLLVPLAAAPGFGYDHPRLPVLTGLAGLLLLLLLLRRERETGPSLLLLAVLLFLGTQLLSIPAGISAWDAVQPALILGSGVAVFLFARAGPLIPNYLPRAGVWIISLLGLVVGALGILQRLVLDLPAISTEGNTNYSGALAAILLPPVGAFAFLKAGLGNRFLCLLAAAALSFMLFLTDARAGLVAAVVGCALFVTALALKRIPWARWSGIAALALLVALPLALRGAHHLSAVRALTASVRIEIWKSSMAMFANRPWIGGGLGSFWTRYPPYRSDREFQITNETLKRRFVEAEDPHSSWMQVATETGTVGLLAFLFLLVAAALRWGRALKSSRDPTAIVILAGLGGGAAAWVAAGCFNTLTAHASHAFLFFIFLGLIERIAPSEPRRAGMPETALLAVAVLAAGVGTSTACRMSYAEHQFTQAMNPPEQLTSDKFLPYRVSHLRRALAVHPASWRARYELAVSLTRLNRPDEALEAYDEVLRHRPHHVPTLSNKAGILLRQDGDEEEIERLYKRAIELAPGFHLTHFGYGLFEFKRSRYPAARSAFRKSIRIKRNNAHAHFWLAEACFLTDKLTPAFNHYRRARNLGFPVIGTLRQIRPGMEHDPRFAELFR